MATCKKCASQIDWRKTEGRWRCFNAGSETDHWDTCKTREWDMIVAAGVRFEDKSGTGYLTKHGKRHDKKSAGVHTGLLYKPSGDCAGCIEPWEVCDWPCPDALAA